MKSQNTPLRQSTTGTALNVLHIIDSPRTAFIFFKSLKEQSDTKFNLTSVNDVAQASHCIHSQHYDALFIHFSNEHHFKLEQIRQLLNKSIPLTLIAIVHDLDDTQINELLAAGIDDYINEEDITTRLLPRMINYAVDRKKTKVQLQSIGLQDAITGLANHNQFLQILQQQFQKTYSPNHLTAVLLINLDQFKNINESKGHAIGDKFLIETAERLKNATRQSDDIARIGGDEFLIMLKGMPNNDSIERVANHVLATLAQSVNLDGNTLFATASIGIAVQSKATKDSESLLKEADIAMNHAKQQGGNRALFFTRDQAVATSLRLALENELIKAIDNEDFFLTFQPQMCAVTGTIYGAEVLLRWQHPIHGELGPNIFIPTLESTGLIAKVTQWVIQQALEQWQQWLAAGVIDLGAHLSINLSPKFLNHPSFKVVLKELNGLSETLKSQVFFEITENLFVDPDSNIENLRFIKSCGFNLAMDDFGTGYSSLSYLKHFPLDCIKLDCAFTKDITKNRIDCAITQAVISLSRDLNICLIAEGVEDVETLDLLKSMGCHYIQGYYYAKPLKAQDFVNYCLALKTSPLNKKAI